MRAERGITSWLRAVAWGAFLIPLVAFAVIAWWGFTRAEHDAENSAARARDLALQHALRTFEVAEEIAHFADEASRGPAELDLAREPAVHQRLADLTSGQHSIVNLNVWNADGRAVASSHIFPVDPRASNADRAYFIAHKVKPELKVGISDVLKGRQLGRPLVNVTVRRKSEDGRFDGVVATSLSPDYFRAYYETLAKENPSIASFSLVRTDGHILARWPASPDGRTQVPNDSLILTRIQAGEIAGNQPLPAMPGRDARFTSFSRIGPYPVYVLAGLSRNAMLESWTHFVALLAAFLFPISAGLVYVSLLALRKTREEQETQLALQDQVERRAAAEKGMIESQKLETLAVLTGGVAHDFNNLLAVISGSVHVHKRLHPQLAGDKQLNSIMRSVQSGVRLTRQLLSFSRKQALRPETLRLQDWLPTTEDLIRTALGSQIRWVSDIDAATAPVTVDPGELELALLNLGVNARHAMPDGGVVTVQVRNAALPGPAGQAMVEIEVADTGAGIAPEVLPRVFEAFFTTRERGLGSGLGLSQVQGFCHQAGGSAEIDSVVGVGTRVRLLLPASAEVVDAAVIASPDKPGELTGTLLLVEDNDEVASSTAFVLRSAGLKVIRAAHAAQALALLQADAAPDVVLSDIAMPGEMNGIALAFELRRTHPALPVLLTTGYAEQVRQATADGLRVLPKPLDPDTLLAELRTVLSRTG